MTVRIDIINRALLGIGSQPLQSEDVPGADAKIMAYETHVGALVSVYPWSFQTRLKQLGQLSTPPADMWTYAYQLPSDMRGSPRAVYRSMQRFDGPIQAYELRERQLHTNEPQIWLRYTFDLTPSLWPDYFIACAVIRLAAEYALSVREDSVLRAKLLADLYGSPEMHGEVGMLAAAKNADSQGQPSRLIPAGINPLLAVRF